MALLLGKVKLFLALDEPPFAGFKDLVALFFLVGEIFLDVLDGRGVGAVENDEEDTVLCFWLELEASS